MELSLSNVINVSVAQAGTGAGAYNTSNIALFTDDTPAMSFTGDYKIYKGPSDVATDFGTSSATYKMALAIFSQQPNILANNGYLVIIPFQLSETLDAAITRTLGLVQYSGILVNSIQTQSHMLNAAAVVQAVNKMALFVCKDPATVEVGGQLDMLRSGGFTKSRGLFYGSTLDIDALVMMASYAGRGFSTNFDGSNTTQNMHLKDLAGVQPDPSMTQTLLAKCQAAGADAYPSLQGIPKVFCSGKNKFFDQVYNLMWFVGAIEIAGFNFLAQTATKIPQTESGMDGLKGAYRKVCQQGATNQYSAPGTWTAPDFFGVQADLIANIGQYGYYIYSAPIGSQSQVAREDRDAPLVQIAIKEAGAIDSSTVLIFVNA